jgi:ABC-type branched-subunit amino acid transport system permease subunit
VKLPGLSEEPVNLTGGPNGIINLDPLRFFGFTAESELDYYYILLFFLILILVIVYHLRNSRLGRALRALREDELAAETMGMPTRWLKLQAFAIGATIAGACGALFAARQSNVFPGNFDLEELIILYAIVVLGGLGSLPGVLIGAAIMLAVPEVLRDVNTAGILFYVGVLITLYATFKPRWQLIPFLAALFVFAVAVTGLLVSSWPGTIAMLSPSSSAPGLWLAIPPEATHIGNLAFGLLIILVLLASRLKNQLWRFMVLIPTLYILAFVWETRLSQEPSVTRLLFVGLLLIVLMIYRPNGLLGQKRVEVV